MRKILFAGIELTSQRVRGLRGTSELPGRPAIYINSDISASFCLTIYILIRIFPALPSNNNNNNIDNNNHNNNNNNK